jgi:hypothetical protein
MRQVTAPLFTLAAALVVGCTTTAPTGTADAEEAALSPQPSSCTTSTECPSATPVCCDRVGVMGAIFGRPNAVVGTCAATCPAYRYKDPQTGEPSFSAQSCETKADCVGYTEIDSDGPHALSGCCAAAVAPSHTLCMDPSIEHNGSWFDGTFVCPPPIN